MKTIQSVARFFPESCGGIQTHLLEILPSLQAQGIESKVAASIESQKEDTYNYQGIEVYRYPVLTRPPEEPNHGEVPHDGFQFFADWLKQNSADIYHQHQWNFTCGLPHLRLAKQLGLATVVTLHLAQAICQRRTMLLNGQQQCDGKIDLIRCSSCCDDLTSKFPNLAVKALSQIPLSCLGRLSLPQSVYAPTSLSNTKGALLRPLAVPAYVKARQRSLQEMAQFADRIVAVCEWLYQALLDNGVPKEKLVLCRCGIADSWQQTQATSTRNNNCLQVGYLGRWSQMKGVHILIEAIKSLPADLPIELKIHAIAEENKYSQQMMEKIKDDSRIQTLPPLTREELPSALAKFDLLAVPSQCLETGPLVVLEAHACGTPVLGSNLGGIAELVQHDINGWLVEANNIQAWADALSKLAFNPNLLDRLRQDIQPVRTVSTEATELKTMYEQILSISRPVCV